MAAPMDLHKFVKFGRKIVCVGRNYKEHAAELGNVMPELPLLFLKPPSAYVEEGSPIQFPKGCSVLHHEVELGVVIGKEVPPEVALEDAMDHVGGYAVALDMTARDLQDAAKKRGHPWSVAKGFNTSCAVGPLLPVASIPDPHALNLWLDVGAERRQYGSTGDMQFRIPQLLRYISAYFRLEPGDLLLTGTPSGVGPVQPGDVITAGIDDLTSVRFEVVA